jgi:hypothetical protein
MNRQIVLAILGSIALSACASPDPGSPAWTAQQAQKKEEARTAAVKDSVSELPSWYNAPPNDEFSIYAPGTSTSTDLQFALDKAILAAKRSVADRVNSKMSSKLKEYLSETAASESVQVINESERVTSNLITEVNLTGYAVTERKVIPASNQYRAYVLVQYPLESANRILVDQVERSKILSGQLRASKAFQELEKDIREAHAPINNQ